MKRDFRLFWAGESVSEVGNSVTIVVLPLVTIETLHASTFVVTVLNAAVWLPWLIIGFPAGAWIDRHAPRPVMLACDAISLAAYASIPIAAWLGLLTVAQLIAATVIAGTATVFFRTAYQVLLPGIVEEADLTEGNAKLMGSREVAQVGGPGLGGLLAQAAGPAIGLFVDAASFAVSFACLTTLRVPREREHERERRPRESSAIKRGLVLLWRDPYLRPMALFAALANVGLTGVDALIVVFLVRTIGLAASLTGLIVAAFGIGGVLGAFLARPLARCLGTARAMLAGSAALAFALLLPLAHPGPALAFAAAANLLVAAGVVIGNVLGASFRQAYVPPGMLGRVSSATMTISFAMMPAGALLAGVLATAFGVRTTLWIMATLICSSGLLYLTTPLRHLRDLPTTSAWADAGDDKVSSVTAGT